MLSDMESGKKVLLAEGAATGGWKTDEVASMDSMDAAQVKRRGKGRLCMIFRLGKHPRCEFTNGFPPEGYPATLFGGKSKRSGPD
ncbi:uncharacterized protein LOC108092887 [Drosophila ficusphila]|uniref:uncharacterized protein LOC108092887 n=1 Tax=Drosophila ficusphila TaxID=30025 RepID=UPI0007E5D4A5|nr:uncharacterized protein LOC108092887 [Drosophila ficusphila]XP_017048220.1 uncharacterized protein LOC108092887 [Drosophila ficusphila]